MNWRWTKPLESDELITEYEERIGYTFPDDFKEFVRQYNGGRPEWKCFYSWTGKRKHERVFNNLLSFNKEDRSSIWKYNDWDGSDWDSSTNGEIKNYVMIARDAFGNLICYDRRTIGIVWVDHEEPDFPKAVEKVADSFTEHVNSLKGELH